MKKERVCKPILCCLLTLCLLVWPNTVSYASNTNEVTTNGSKECVVSAVIASTYTASIPTSLTLNKSDNAYKFTATYKVGAKGNIAANQTLHITPDRTFQMADVNNSTVTAQASVSQSITKWKYNYSSGDTLSMNKNTYTEATGTVTVTFSQAGTYRGKLGFLVELKTD